MPRAVHDRADAIPALAEVFREYGYEGASLAIISQRTGLGKGSLYNFFPGGKAEMAEAVLDHIAAWFERAIYAPLRDHRDAAVAIRQMFDNADAYFHSGQRVCLVGALALAESRNLFGERIKAWFAAWREALAAALRRLGRKPDVAADMAEDCVAAMQGALVAARAFGEIAIFGRMLARLEARMGLG